MGREHWGQNSCTKNNALASSHHSIRVRVSIPSRWIAIASKTNSRSCRRCIFFLLLLLVPVSSQFASSRFPKYKIASPSNTNNMNTKQQQKKIVFRCTNLEWQHTLRPFDWARILYRKRAIQMGLDVFFFFIVRSRISTITKWDYGPCAVRCDRVLYFVLFEHRCVAAIGLPCVHTVTVRPSALWCCTLCCVNVDSRPSNHSVSQYALTFCS